MPPSSADKAVIYEFVQLYGLEGNMKDNIKHCLCLLYLEDDTTMDIHDLSSASDSKPIEGQGETTSMKS